MTSVQTHRPATSVSSPEPASRALLDVVSRYQNRLEDGTGPLHKILSAGLAPTAAERRMLEDRRSDLRSSLQTAAGGPEQELLARIVAGILAAFPTYGAGEAQGKIAIGMVCRALDDVPVWAVQRAAGNFLKGRQKIAWNPEKAPTPPQIRSEAMLAVLDVETELHRLSQVLDAELVDNDTTENERAAALAHWAQIRAGIASTNVLTERTDEEIAAERAAMQRANERVRAREAAGKAKQEVTA